MSAPRRLGLVAAAVIGVSRLAYGQTPGVCSVAGTVTDHGHPLPGVVVTLKDAGGKIIDISSSAPDGTFQLKAPSGAQGSDPFRLTAELIAFATVSRDVSVDFAACPARLDVAMTLASRAVARAPAHVAASEPRPSSPQTEGFASGATSALPPGGRGGPGRGGVGGGPTVSAVRASMTGGEWSDGVA